MLNEKGLVVSSILYTLLIAFLLFLGVTLSTFQASSRLISNSNKDLINGTKLTATVIKLNDACSDNIWYNTPYLIKINSRYGTSYWPRDYGSKDNDNNGVLEGAATEYKDKITVKCAGTNCNNFNFNDSNISTKKITFTEGTSTAEVTLGNFCS